MVSKPGAIEIPYSLSPRPAPALGGPTWRDLAVLLVGYQEAFAASEADKAAALKDLQAHNEALK